MEIQPVRPLPSTECLTQPYPFFLQYQFELTNLPNGTQQVVIQVTRNVPYYTSYLNLSGPPFDSPFSVELPVGNPPLSDFGK